MSWLDDEDELCTAKVAYDAYAQALGRLEEWKPWVSLTVEEQRAWREAAKAARRVLPAA